MALIDRIQARNHSVSLKLIIDGSAASIQPIKATVDLGYDTVSARAVITFPEPVNSQFRNQMQVQAGWDGFLMPIFTGYVEEDSQRWFPYDDELHGAGWLRQTQFQTPVALTYNSMTDTAIIQDLTSKAAVPFANVQGAAVTLAQTKTITLEPGRTYWELINEIDQVFSYKTFDTSSGQVQRRLITGVPQGSGAFAYASGDPNYPIFSIDRPRTIATVHNQVSVYGLAGADTWPVTSNATNSFVPNPPGYYTLEFRSDLIESDNVAITNVNPNLMTIHNRVVEEITLDVPGNPMLQPGMTITIQDSHIGYNSATPVMVKHITHIIDETGFISRLIVEGGTGNPGAVVPNPSFSWSAVKEFDSSGNAQWDIIADGSTSWDPIYPVSSLSFSWSNSATAATSTKSVYGFQLTDTQLNAKPTVTLTVTDPTGANANTSLVIDPTDPSFTFVSPKLYVAANGHAWATGNGGQTWLSWAPSSGNVISTAEVAAQNAQYGTYFGLDNGQLWIADTTFLANPPTQATVPWGATPVNCIWINENNAADVWVGLGNGQLWNTTTGGVVGATWTLKFTFGAAINWVVNADPNQVYVAMSNQMLQSLDTGATFQVLTDLGASSTAYRLSIWNGIQNGFVSGNALSSGPGAFIADDGLPKSQPTGYGASSSATGGAINKFGGTGAIFVVWVTSDGSPCPSTQDSQNVAFSWGTTSTQLLTVTAPTSAAPSGAVGWYAYYCSSSLTQGFAEILQSYGTPTPIGTNAVFTSLPNKAAGPANNSTGVAAAGGTLTAGTYYWKLTGVDAAGNESLFAASTVHAPGSATATAGQQITITSPGATDVNGNTLTGYYVYAGTASTGPWERQQPHGSPTPIGTNYNLGGTNGGAPGALVKRADGVPITLPVLAPVAATVKGLTNNATVDTLYAGDDQGRTYAAVAGATSFVHQGDLPSTPGSINLMTTDVSVNGLIYAAADNGVYKSWDDGLTWGLMKALTTPDAGKMLGYALFTPGLLLAKQSYWSNQAQFSFADNAVLEGTDLWNGTTNNAKPAHWDDASYAPTGFTGHVDTGPAIPASTNTRIVLHRSDGTTSVYWQGPQATNIGSNHIFIVSPTDIPNAGPSGSVTGYDVYASSGTDPYTKQNPALIPIGQAYTMSAYTNTGATLTAGTTIFSSPPIAVPGVNFTGFDVAGNANATGHQTTFVCPNGSGFNTNSGEHDLYRLKFFCSGSVQQAALKLIANMQVLSIHVNGEDAGSDTHVYPTDGSDPAYPKMLYSTDINTSLFVVGWNVLAIEAAVNTGNRQGCISFTFSVA